MTAVNEVHPLVRSLLASRSASWLVRPGDRLIGAFPVPIARPPVAPHYRVLRADDMIVLDVALHGLATEPSPDGRLLRRTRPNAVLVAHFPPQAFAEEVFVDTSLTDAPSPLPTDALPAAARHAGQSRLAFRMPAELKAVAFTTAGVLRAMAEWPLVRAPIQLTDGFADDLVVRLEELAHQAAQLLPAEHAGPASRIADRAALRAAASVRGSLSTEAFRAARESLTAELAPAIDRLGLDDEQRAALSLRGDLTLAGRIVAVEAPRLGAGGVIDVLPGLWWLYAPHRPGEAVTAIELPYRLVQSPGDGAAFSHALAAVTRSGRTELWHTRLGQRDEHGVIDATDTVSTLAAIWSPDYDRDSDEEPAGFPTSLDPQDRDEIVQLTADQTGFLPGKGARHYRPVPSRAHRLMLTTLGGWLDLEGKWDKRPANKDGFPLSLVSWKHHAALGRDWFVETVRIGQMLPLGHRAVRVTLTERRFQEAPDGSGHVAALRQRVFVEIREPLRAYPTPTQPFDGRDFPLSTVEILTKRAPNLLPFDPAKGESKETFWPRIADGGAGSDFRFEIRTTDFAGNVARYDLPLRFVSDAVAVAPAIAQYNGADQNVAGRTTASLAGQAVQLAPPANRLTAAGAPDPGDIVYPVTEARFGAADPTSPPPLDGSKPRFYPFLRSLHVMSTALSQMTGNNTPAEMSFASVYRQNGFNPSTNKAELLLTVTGAPTLQADFATRSSSDKAGGIVTPNFGVSGTSRAFGLVGGDTNLLAGGTFDPGSFFPSAKVFGGIDLKDIIAPVVVALAGATVPKLKTTRTREKIETVFEHRCETIHNFGPLRANERGTSKLDIKATMTAYFQVADPVERDADGHAVSTIGQGPGAVGGNPPGLKDPEASAEATLTWFKLNFFGCIIVSFDSFKFKASASKGVDADPKIASTDGVVFGGPLAFVDNLRHSLSGGKKSSGASGGGSGGGGGGGGGGGIPGFEVTPIFKPEISGLTVGVKLGITKSPVGIFVMKNLMVSTAVKLPFDGKPLSLQFGFAERANPFQLVVSLLGGGGFLVIGIDTEHGVKEIEAALEFGAFAEIDVGVASGAVYIKAGIYMYWNKPDEQTTLKGYVEMGGEVQVLGIMSVSILMHLSLGYYKVGKVSEVRGQATLVVEIELLFFSASVNLTVERRFGGAEADPTFHDLIPAPAMWQSYADAFA